MQDTGKGHSARDMTLRILCKFKAPGKRTRKSSCVTARGILLAPYPVCRVSVQGVGGRGGGTPGLVLSGGGDTLS